MRPTVPTRCASCEQRRSTARIASAAAASASWRAAIGTVPAWPAMPCSGHLQARRAVDGGDATDRQRRRAPAPAPARCAAPRKPAAPRGRAARRRDLRSDPAQRRAAHPPSRRPRGPSHPAPRGPAFRQSRDCRAALNQSARPPHRQSRRSPGQRATARRRSGGRTRSRSPRPACRRTGRHRARCPGASRASGPAGRGALPSRRPVMLPMASTRARMPASRIQASHQLIGLAMLRGQDTPVSGAAGRR